MDLLIENASQILTCAGPGPLAGRDAGRLSITAGAIAIADGRIVAAGPDAAGREAREVIDAAGGIVLPGFVDCHTHTVFVGSRADEFEDRVRGVGYEEIAQRGGGIRSSMRQLRAASDDELADAVRRNLDRFLDHGTTTIEAKSGYGLSLEDELRSLRALGVEHDVEVVRTCLAAHTTPPEFKGDGDAYVRLVCEEILPAVAKEGLAEYVDVFCERGVFSRAQAERVLQAGLRVGLRARVHADQLSRSGGSALAAEIGAVSAEHLEFTTKADAEAMRDAGVVAVLLPAANYVLDQEERTPARKFIGLGLPVAVASDFNPGSSPVQSMPLVLNFACVRFGLSVAEAIVGATLNAACAVGRGDRIGSIEPGKQADLIVCDAADYRELAYWLGRDTIRTVVKKGRLVRSRPTP